MGLGNEIVAALRELGRSIVAEVREHSGPLTSHLREVLKLPPEVYSIEMVSLMGRVGTTTLTNPEKVTVPGNVDFEIFGIAGTIESPDDGTSENFTRLEFQLQNQGRGKADIFLQPVNMGFLLGSPLAPPKVMEFKRSLYVARARTDLKVVWSRRTDAGAWIGPDKDVGIVLIGGNILHG